MRHTGLLLAVVTTFVLGATACSGDDKASQAAPESSAQRTSTEAVDIFLAGQVVRRDDSGDEGIRGVTVVMRRQGGGSEIKMVTGRSGQFSRRSMPPGTYAVRIEGLQPGQKFRPMQLTVAKDNPNVFLPPLVVSD